MVYLLNKKFICYAEHIIEIGPKAGIEGGTVVYQGGYGGYEKVDTLLSKYIFGKCTMSERKVRRDTFDKEDCLTLEHGNTHYLKDLTVVFPLHAMVGIAELSESGKSSLIEETLLKRLASARKYGHATGLTGIDQISSFVNISQEPIGRSTSSTPVSYIGIGDKIRELFAEQPEEK
ncbi:hypothetical protein [Alkaliphilus metalliredigens]|uniref:hypothetical protein n=1 Tax=Alkaliphilus metalliredigens TaxID=208226 RepID=UPI0012EEB175|nr:hypothetical protein [Alkaliphilus metalliredigens]